MKEYKRGMVLVLTLLICNAAVAEEKIMGEAANDLPIFDAHMHYHDPAWAEFPPSAVLDKMNNNKVGGSLLSAAPDQGAVQLHEYSPGRFVLEASPYRDDIGKSNWTTSDTKKTLGYMTRRLDLHPHEGMGELVVTSFDPDNLELLRELALLAESRNLLMHIHADFRLIEAMFEYAPGLTIVWAHAGMVDPPQIVSRTIDKYDNLYADLSYRENQILSVDGKLNPQWREVLIAHSDRFMVGTDTWASNRWANYDELIQINRQWLALMPKSVAEAIAYKNAERIFKRRWSETDFENH